MNSNANVGYDGPLGTLDRKRRYRFHLFALDAGLHFTEPPDRDELIDAMRGHVLADAELRATHARPTD